MEQIRTVSNKCAYNKANALVKKLGLEAKGACWQQFVNSINKTFSLPQCRRTLNLKKEKPTPELLILRTTKAI